VVLGLIMMKYDTQRFSPIERQHGYLTFSELLTSNSPLQITLMTQQQTDQAICTHPTWTTTSIWDTKVFTKEIAKCLKPF